MLRVVVISSILAVLGLFYVFANPGDPGMRGFGYFLVVVGSLIAGVFLYVWARKGFFADNGGEGDRASDAPGEGEADGARAGDGGRRESRRRRRS